MKRISTTLVSIAMLFLFAGMIGVNAATTGSTGNLTWNLTDEGVLIISGNGQMPDYQTGTSPWYSHRNEIKQICVKEGVTSIGQAAFQNLSNATYVDIPSTVTSIGGWGFYACSKLESVVIPKATQSIGKACFAESYCLNNVKILSSSLKLGWRCFWSCRSLKTMICLTDDVAYVDPAYYFGDPNEPFAGDSPYDEEGTLYVPGNLIDSYKNTNEWKEWKNIVSVDALYEHEYVDLGLPSGTLWATCNIGADKPEDYGDYFAWGETIGYNSGKTNFSWKTYKWCNGSETTMTKYCTDLNYGTIDNKTELDLSDDVAYVNWGSNWRMPTSEQIDELINGCTVEMSTSQGVNGFTVTSKHNGNSIFLPAAGYYDGTVLNVKGICGDYTTSDLYADSDLEQCNLYFNRLYSSFYNDHGPKYHGRSVRPVTIGENKIVSEWYTVKIRTDKYVRTSVGNSTVYAVKENPAVITDDYLWGFILNADGTYTIVNKAYGMDYALCNQSGTNDGSYVSMGSYSKAEHFTRKEASGGYYFVPSNQSGETTYLNDYCLRGIMGYSSSDDDGSVWRLTKVGTHSYDRCEYIANDVPCVINTGIIPTENTSFELEMDWGKATDIWMGSYDFSESTRKVARFFVLNGKLCYDFPDDWGRSGYRTYCEIDNSKSTRHKYSFGNNYIFDVSTNLHNYGSKVSSFQTKGPFGLFGTICYESEGQYIYGCASEQNQIGLKIYSFKAYEGDRLIANMVPVQVGDNVCLYDSVRMSLFERIDKDGNALKNILATQVIISDSILTFTVGERKNMIATVLPEDATDKSVTWSSSNQEVASVASDGTVTAVSAGEAVITAKTNDGSNLTASCTVTVAEQKKEKVLELGTGGVCVPVQYSFSYKYCGGQFAFAEDEIEALKGKKITGIAFHLTEGYSIPDSMVTIHFSQGEQYNFSGRSNPYDLGRLGVTVRDIALDADGWANIPLDYFYIYDGGGLLLDMRNRTVNENCQATFYVSATNFCSSASWSDADNYRKATQYGSTIYFGATVSARPNVRFTYCDLEDGDRATFENTDPERWDGVSPLAVNLSETTLQDAICEEDARSITDLTLKGEMSIEDLVYLLYMLGKYSDSSTEYMLPDVYPNLSSDFSYGSTAIERIDLSEVAFPKDEFYNITNPPRQHIMDYMFSGIRSLRQVIFPENLVEIGDYAFYNCTELQNVKFPSSLATIGQHAFDGCYSFTEVAIPNSTVSVGENAFNTYGIKTLKLGKSLSEIAEYAFGSNPSVIYNYMPEPYEKFILYMYETDTLYVPQQSLELYKNSPYWNRENNPDLQIIPLSEEYFIAEIATAGTLSEVVGTAKNTIASLKVKGNINGTDIKTIREMAGSDGNLSDLDLSEANIVSGGESYYYWWDTKTENNKVGDYMFSDCQKLNIVKLPNSATAVGNQVFCSCENLHSVDFGDNVSSIGSGVFNNTFNLYTLRFGSQLKNIDGDMFVLNSNDFSSSLKYVYCEAEKAPSGFSLSYSNYIQPCVFIPAGSTNSYKSTDGWQDFKWKLECGETYETMYGITADKYYLETSSLNDIPEYIGEKVTHLKYTGKFDADNYICARMMSIDALDLSQCTGISTERDGNSYIFSDAAWYLKKLTSKYGSSEISDSQFYGLTGEISPNFNDCTGPANIDVNSLNINKSCMFSGLGLYELILPENLITVLGPCALSENDLKSIHIPSSVTEIGDYALWKCSSRYDGCEITFSDGENLKHIGSHAFHGSSLRGLDIPDGVTSLGKEALFYSLMYNSEGAISIPASLTVMGQAALAGTRAVDINVNPENRNFVSEDGIVFNKAKTTLEAYPSGKKYGTYTIRDGVTKIDTAAFYGCRADSIIISECVQHIEPYAFSWSNIKYVELGKELTTIADYAFNCCQNLETVVNLSDEPQIITAEAFHWGKTDTLKVPYGTSALYKSAEGWKNFKVIEELPIDDSRLEDFDNVVYMEKTIGYVGTPITFTLKMKNNVDAVGFQVDIYMPEGVTFATDEDGFPLAELSTARTSKMKTDYFNAVVQSDGSLRVLCSSSRGYAFSGYDGEVATFVVQLPVDMSIGDYPVTLKKIEISEKNTTSHKVDIFKSTLTVSEYLLGDANRDGDVSVSDFTSIANHILGNTTQVFLTKAADVNGDDDITVSDLTGVANIILYGSVTGASSVAALAGDEAQCVLSVDVADFSLVAGQTVDVPVCIQNAGAGFSAYQFDLTLPGGVAVEDIVLSTERTSARATDFFSWKQLADGSYRVLCASTSGSVFEGTDGAVAILRLTAVDEAMESIHELSIDNIELSRDGRGMHVDGLSKLFMIDGVTGLNSVDADKNGCHEVYDLTGKRIMDGRRGQIKIVNNKKYIEK